MSNNRLHEGIIVKPSSGRTTLNIPEVVGTSVAAVNVPDTSVEIEVHSAVVDASDAYPLRFSIAEHLRLRGLQPPYEINAVSIRELSNSARSEPWATDNAFATVDAHGMIEYVPQGATLRNALVVEFQILGSGEQPNTDAEILGQVYQGNEEVADQHKDAQNRVPIVPENVMHEGQIILPLKNDLLGDPVAARQFWQSQGMEPTCAIAAASSVLLSLGIDVDYETLLAQAVTEIPGFTGAGSFLYTAHSIKTVLIEPSKPMRPEGGFSQYLTEPLPRVFFDLSQDGTPEEIAAFLSANQSFPSALRQYLQELHDYRASEDYDGYEQTSYTDIQTGTNAYGIARMLEHNGVNARLGYGGDFADIVNELLQGNRLIVTVDAHELAGSQFIRMVQDESDLIALLTRPESLNSGANHAVWLTGIDTLTEGGPYVILNDSGNENGAGLRVSLAQFIAAWEDGDYSYITTGDPPPSISTEAGMLRGFIEDSIRDLLVNANMSTEAADQYLSSSFHKAIQSPTIRADLPEVVQNAIDEYIDVNNADKRFLLEQTGLDDDEIQRLKELLDLE